MRPPFSFGGREASPKVLLYEGQEGQEGQHPHTKAKVYWRGGSGPGDGCLRPKIAVNLDQKPSLIDERAD